MTDEAKPSILTVLQSILSALTGGAISGGGSGTTPVLPEGAATEAHQSAIIIKLSELLTELSAKASAGEAQLVQLPASAASVTKQDEIITQLAGLLTELRAKADLNETQPVRVVPGTATTTVTVAASLNADTNVIPAGLLSVTIINNSTSAGAMTVATANGSAALNPGEAVTFDAENPNSLLDGITVTGGFAITGRLFATKRAAA